MKPIVHKLQKEGLPVMQIDTDRHSTISRRYNVSAIPTFVLLVDGKPTDRAVGAVGELRLRTLLARIPKASTDPLAAKQLDFKKTKVQARLFGLLMSQFNKDAFVQLVADAELRKFGKQLAGELVALAGSKKKPIVLRVAAVRGLTAIQREDIPPRAAVQLSAILDDGSEITDLRGYAAAAMMHLRQPHARIDSALIAAFKSARSESQRVDAAVRLGQRRSTAAIPALTAAVKDSPPDVQSAAISALAEFGKDAHVAVPALLQCIEDAEGDAPKTIEKTLSAITRNAPQGAEALANGLKSSNAGTRAMCMRLLKQAVFPAPAATALMKALGDDDPVIRRDAAILLSRIGRGSGKVVPVLIDGLKSGRSWETQNAISRYGSVAVGTLLNTIRNKKLTRLHRFRAAQTLARIVSSRKQIAPELRKMLQSQDAVTRLCAAVVLSRDNPTDDRVADILLAAITDEEDEIRVRSLELLRYNSSNRKVTDRLLTLLKTGDKEYRMDFAYALGGRELKENDITRLAAMLAEPEMIAAAATVLSGSKKQAVQAVPSILAAIEKAGRSTRRTLSQALAAGGSQAVPGLRKALSKAGASNVLKVVVIQSLVSIGADAKAAADDIRPLLKDTDESVRIWSAIALANWGGDLKPLLPHLIDGLRSTDYTLNYQAENALSRIGGDSKQAIEAVIKVANGDNERAAGRALSILPAIGRKSPEAIQTVVSRLKTSVKENRRRSAVYSAARFGKPAIKVLLEALDRKEYSRPDVIAVLRSMRTRAKPAVSRLKGLLDDEESALPAALALSEIDPEASEAVPILVRALGETKPGDSYRIISAIGRFGPKAKAAVPALVSALDEERSRSAAFRALERIGPAAAPAVPSLTRYLAAPSYTYAALNALRGTGPAGKSAIPEILKLLRDDRNAWSAAQATAAIQPDIDTVRPAIEKLIADLEGETRKIVACRALGPLGKQWPTKIVPALIKSAGSDDAEFRAAAFSALGETQSKQAIPVLIGGLRDTELKNRRFAISALGRFGKDAKPAVADLIGILKNEKELRYTVLRALEQIGPDAAEALPELLKLLDDKSYGYTAARAIGALGRAAVPAVPALVKRMQQAKSDSYAIFALGQLGVHAKAALPELHRISREGTRLQRTAAENAIDKIEGKTD